MRLAERQPDGTRLRDHLEALERRGGRRHPLLDGPPLPAAAAHLWQWFLELRAANAAPLTFSEIRAWAALTGQWPRPWEVAALRALDAACRAGWGGTDGR